MADPTSDTPMNTPEDVRPRPTIKLKPMTPPTPSAAPAPEAPAAPAVPQVDAAPEAPAVALAMALKSIFSPSFIFFA